METLTKDATNDLRLKSYDTMIEYCDIVGDDKSIWLQMKREYIIEKLLNDKN
jgi:hypothetical protein